MSEAQHQPIPWIVVDSTVVSGHDRYLESAAGLLLRDESKARRVRLAVPEVVLLEANANHQREVDRAQKAFRQAGAMLQRLRAPLSSEEPGRITHIGSIWSRSFGMPTGRFCRYRMWLTNTSSRRPSHGIHLLTKRAVDIAMHWSGVPSLTCLREVASR